MALIRIGLCEKNRRSLTTDKALHNDKRLHQWVPEPVPWPVTNADLLKYTPTFLIAELT